MKIFKSFLALSLAFVLLFSSVACSGPEDGKIKIDADEELPSGFLKNGFDVTYSGSVFQTGDGKAHITGNVSATSPRWKLLSYSSASSQNTELVTFEHNIKNCYVGSYLGKGLFGVQDYGNLSQNKFGIASKDGTILHPMGESGFFSLSSMYEDRIIVGNPTAQTSDMYDQSESYLFGYMIYDEESKTVSPMYESNNLRFYTAGYFIDGLAIVSVLDGDEIKFGVIDLDGNYVVEPTYDSINDESYNGAVIAASSTQDPPHAINNFPLCLTSRVGRSFAEDGMHHSRVQGKRRFAYASDSIGIIELATGKELLKCEYKYVERIVDGTYYVVDRNGEKFLFDMSDASLTPVEYACAYFNSEWYIIKAADGEFYLVDKSGEKYSTKSMTFSDKIRLSSNSAYGSVIIGGAVGSFGPDGLIFGGSSSGGVLGGEIDNPDNFVGNGSSDKLHGFLQSEYFECNENNVMTNILTPVRDEIAEELRKAPDNDILNGSVTLKNGTLTNTVTGQKIENILSHSEVYRNSMLIVLGNDLYYIDLGSFETTRVETGFGGFAESIAYSTGEAVGEFHTELDTLRPGVIAVTYELIEYVGGYRTYHKIIVNDKGTVLLDSNINATYVFSKNYLGKYDTPLYELAGSTNIEDNYLMSSTTGNDFLLQLVRGESELQTESEKDGVIGTNVRTIREFREMMYMSPFRFGFANADGVTVKANGKLLDASAYIFDSEKQTLLFKHGALYDREDFCQGNEEAILEIEVIAGGESATVYVKYSPISNGMSY